MRENDKGFVAGRNRGGTVYEVTSLSQARRLKQEADKTGHLVKITTRPGEQYTTSFGYSYELPKGSVGIVIWGGNHSDGTSSLHKNVEERKRRESNIATGNGNRARRLMQRN